jgi:hypothetical protein
MEREMPEPSEPQLLAAAPEFRARRHADAVTNTLKMADEAADEQKYDDALHWLSMLEAIGERLPDHYESRRLDWSAKLTARNGGAQR